MTAEQRPLVFSTGSQQAQAIASGAGRVTLQVLSGTGVSPTALGNRVSCQGGMCEVRNGKLLLI